ncbi:heme A synthase [Pseudooceanicola marinus]|uniref:heme A synthase n=1 Tax=Pseudooceanicola marinus TaxID=396013 RepID=UPI001CD64918|nr:heme A synthase [Pseudooceanicola marinus]MCA1334378.1 COX15/CtaA family protein [Pseudooceanicola marinus]
MSEKRSIFEEVGSDDARPEIRKGGIDAGRRGSRKGLRAWLIVLFLMVAVMIVVGGLTRLTDSGLSITEWKPLSGALPPMTQADWEAEFALYQQIPQFTEMNSWMELSDFKQIYWWEWGHRQLGRAIGLVWAIGFLGFWVSGRMPAGWVKRSVLIGAMGGAQGAIGWWMVSSGLGEGMLSVASYRLAVHLGLAFAILGTIAWYVFLLSREERDLMQARRVREAKQFGLATGWMHFAFLQILLGALVAGIDAGRSFTDWPTMGGQFFPPYAFDIEPVWRNFLENPGLVQFIHRMSGYLLLIFGTVAFLRGRRSANPATRRAFTAAYIALWGQVALGVAAVMTAAHLHVAITHQVVAVLLWVLILRARFAAAYPVATSVRG